MVYSRQVTASSIPDGCVDQLTNEGGEKGSVIPDPRCLIGLDRRGSLVDFIGRLVGSALVLSCRRLVASLSSATGERPRPKRREPTS